MLIKIAPGLLPWVRNLNDQGLSARQAIVSTQVHRVLMIRAKNGISRAGVKNQPPSQGLTAQVETL